MSIGRPNPLSPGSDFPGSRHDVPDHDGELRQLAREWQRAKRSPAACAPKSLSRWRTRCPVRHTRVCTVLPFARRVIALRSSARSGYLMRRLRHAVSRPCDAICAVLEPSAVLRVVRCGRCCSHIRFCDELIADALSPLPRACGASAHQLAAADAPCAASRADAFRIASTVALACVTTLVFVRRREAASQHAVESHSYPSASGSNPLSNSPAPDISDLGPELQAAGKSEHEPLPRQKGPRLRVPKRMHKKSFFFL